MPGTGQQPFAYSDGDDAENYVYDVIANASDTSSTSAELESRIRDWPSEYHFTSRRATLLRALDLSGMQRVLELGCGCGAISRYLGEQGMQVDAIEGSTRRAQIAHSRCRDLDNVNIVNANYNDLSLPDGEYDAIFLIGVLEYAKRFCPDAEDDFAAVHEVLTAIGKSLKPVGVMITAIENRLGLKYLLGATEDHYAVPYIGLHEYPDSAGIRTFDHDEWQGILDSAGFPEREFYAPFPDYKIPTVVMHEGFLGQPQAASHLRGLTSRDYLHDFSSPVDENIFWKAFQQGGSLLNFANSYLIVAGRHAGNIDRIACNDFVHVSGQQRKLAYRTVTSKRRGALKVTKQRLAASGAEDIPGIQQLCMDEDYIQGELLSETWLNTLMIWQDMDRLVPLFRRYHDYLKDYAHNNEAARDIFDVLPFNIVVDDQGDYQSFDREWKLDEVVTPEYVLFRGLFWFVFSNSSYFTPLFKKEKLHSTHDFLLECFSRLGLELEKHLPDYIAFEESIQEKIGLLYTQRDLTLSLNAGLSSNRSGLATYHPRVYWAEQGHAFSEGSSLITTSLLGAERQEVVFNLPVSLPANSRVRFDPAEREGYFHIYSLRVISTDDDGTDKQTLLSLDSGVKLAQSAKMHGLTLHGGSSRAVFVANNDDPWFEVTLPTGGKQLQLIVEMDWPHSEEYEIVRAELQQLNNEWQWEKEKLVQEIAALKRERDASSRTDITPQQGVLTRVLKKLKG